MIEASKLTFEIEEKCKDIPQTNIKYIYELKI